MFRSRRFIQPAVYGAAGGVAWTPLTGSATVWYDATNAASLSTTTNGASLATWNDISGNGHHLSQVTTANQPLYTTGVLNSLPGIHFQNPGNNTATASQMGTAAFTLAQPFTLMMVIKNGAGAINNINGNNLFAILFDGDVAAAGTRFIFLPVHNSFSNHAVYTGGTGIDTGALLSLNTGYHLMTVAPTGGTTWSSDINGTTTSGQNAGAAGIINGVALGCLLSGNLTDCYVCEAFVLPNTTNQSQALAYVSAKWGV